MITIDYNVILTGGKNLKAGCNGRTLFSMRCFTSFSMTMIVYEIL